LHCACNRVRVFVKAFRLSGLRLLRPTLLEMGKKRKEREAEAGAQHAQQEPYKQKRSKGPADPPVREDRQTSGLSLAAVRNLQAKPPIIAATHELHTAGRSQLWTSHRCTGWTRTKVRVACFASHHMSHLFVF
jgi:hypothetical protein